MAAYRHRGVHYSPSYVHDERAEQEKMYKLGSASMASLRRGNSHLLWVSVSVVLAFLQKQDLLGFVSRIQNMAFSAGLSELKQSKNNIKWR